MAEEDWYHLQRRANPPGWTQPAPGSNFNPYDPHDKRPAEGYPSEFKTPGRQSNWSTTPTDATQFQQMKTTMRKLQYTPRPHSKLYPGQLMQLRRVNNYNRFDRGVLLTGRTLMAGVVIYGVFIHRWNDGYENIFSDLYRFHLRFKWWLLGSLSDVEHEDLTPNFRTQVRVSEGLPSLNDSESKPVDSRFAMERPERKHLVEAQRILQEREERLLRALDIAENELKNQEVNSSAASSAGSKKKWWSFS